MIIDEIALCNFGVYRNPQRIILSYASKNDHRPITLIGGNNGSGKTTLLDAVLLALYGKTSYSFLQSGCSYTSYIENYMHRGAISEDKSWVRLVIRVPIKGELVRLAITRQWEKKGSRVGERLRITRNGVEDEFLAQSWQYYVEDILPSGLAKLFFFNGETIIALAEDETGEAIREAIFSVFGIDTIDRIVLNMGRIIRKNEKRLEKDREYSDEVGELRRELRALVQKLNMLRQELAQVEAKVAQLESKARQVEISLVRKGLTVGENRVAAIVKKENYLQIIETVRQQLIDLAGGALPLVMVKPLLERAFAQMEEERKARSAASALPVISQNYSELLEILEEIKIDNEDRKKLHEVLYKHQRAVSAQAETETVLGVSDRCYYQTESLLSGKLDNVVLEAKRASLKFEETKRKLEQIDQHLLVEIDKSQFIDEVEEYKNLQEEIGGLKERRERLKEEMGQLSRKVAELERKMQTQMQRYLEQSSQESDAARIVEYASRTIQVMKRFRTRVIEEKVASLATGVEAAFMQLLHKERLVEEISIDPDTLRVVLTDGLGREVPKSRLSAGEKQMLAVAILWGLAKSSGKIIPVIIDTPLSRLDYSHRENLIKYYLPYASHQVVILSTDSEIDANYRIMLGSSVGRQYLLRFDDSSRCTTVVEGYFQPQAEGDLYDSKTNKAVQSG